MISLLLVVLLQLTPIPFEPIPSPTPIPTSTPIPVTTPQLPTENLINGLATAENNLNQVPENLTNPSGQPLLPANNGATVFSYARWLFSAPVGRELFGPFALIFDSIAAVLTVLIVLALIYVAIQVAVLLVRFIVWIVTNVLKLIPFFG